jgi:hypothetical protein
VANGSATEHFKYGSTQGLCDSLLDAIRLDLPEVSRREAQNWCVFRATPSSRGFGFIDQQKTRLKIYLLATETDESEWQSLASSHGISLEKRTTIAPGRNFEARTPFFVFIDTTTIQGGRALLLKAAGGEGAPPANATEYVSEIDEGGFAEGGGRTLTVNMYERDPGARRECIRVFGCQCAICGFDFERTYSDMGEGFIHVHHLVPVAKIKKRYRVVPSRDMRPVCPNCQEMLHRKTPPFTIEEMRGIIRSTGHLKAY